MIDHYGNFRQQQGLPDKEQLLAYSPEEAAQLVLKLVPKDRPAFIPGDVIRHMSDSGYGGDLEVDHALMEGVAYLERYGLLIEDLRSYTGSGRGRALSRQGRELAQSPAGLTNFIASIKDPRALLHSDITAKALPLYERGREFFDEAATAALKAVEVAVRKGGGFSESEIGVPLMRKAFGEGGPLRDPKGDPGEENGYRELFGGAIAVYKNPPSHRFVDWRDSLSVLRILILASELLHTIEERPSVAAVRESG
jgi:uncharacterized protein (TIGR02391 family)